MIYWACPPFEREDALNRTMRIMGSALALLLLLPALAMDSSAQSAQPIGSQWVYEFEDEFYGIVFSGTWTYSCERATTTTLGGTERAVIEYRSVLSATASMVNEGSGMADGEMTAVERQYCDAETNDIVGYMLSESYTLDAVIYGSGSISINSSEQNETAYLPPGGTGTEPSGVSPGDTWQKSYTKHSKAIGHDGADYYSRELTLTEIVSFKYIGPETITVPAGTFACSKYDITTSDGVHETAWYSNEASYYAKVTDVYSGGETVDYQLRSYRLVQASGTPIQMGSNLFLAAFYSMVAITVIAGVYAMILVRKRRTPF